MNNTTTTTVIEVNGVKLEIDLRQAKRIDHLRVGTRVKVLKKEYSTHKVHHGIIIGFEPFEKLPTIIVACALIEYNQAKIEFVYYNSSTVDVEVVAARDDDFAAIDKANFIKQVDREIAAKQREIAELEARKQYFLDKFQSYWTPLESAVADATAGIQEL